MKGKKLKFKAGDKVRVRSLEWYNNKPKDEFGDVRLGYGWEFIKDMAQYCGKVLKISRIYDNAYKVDDYPYYWQDWMLENEVVTEEEQEVEQLNKDKMETKEMTQEEVFAYLNNTKILCTSTDKTTKVQKKLFKLGIEWGVFGKAVDEDVFLLFISNNRIEFTHDIEAWVISNKKQIEPSEILAIQIKEEKPKFDPKTLRAFDKVLVRDCNAEKWRARFFDRREECGECEYGTTCNCFWVYCIPYNEETKHLHGTNHEEPEFYRI